jgi:Mlc titration factor MtfA (ptsG expression regulator)
MLIFTDLRRKRLKLRPFPPAWLSVMERSVPLYNRLSLEDRTELQGHVRVFLAEKRFEGGGSFTMTDEVRVTIASQACILLLHRKTDYYPDLSSIVVYPAEYLAPFVGVDEWGVVTEGTDQRSGESCPEGALVLSWEDVMAEGIDVHEGYNVVLHEFAHQLDAGEGITAGIPLEPENTGEYSREDVLTRAYRQLREDDALGRPTVLDPYGAESPEEFFAVATEAFFQIPHPFNKRYPGLYEELSRYYRQDPAGWTTGTGDITSID